MQATSADKPYFIALQDIPNASPNRLAFLFGAIVLRMKPAGRRDFPQRWRCPNRHLKTKINENEKKDISAVIACYKKKVEMALIAVRFGVE
ncbi:hypothetical protein QBD01_003633 [Ochrobactrum sp. 19YEA23]|uniref:hypothetical protein n=1 Tax=Ochrobactrum sp. 19YEA23 TaxID=3039854 RepID=UPI00247B0B0C|nr:hypothetical protein [Ochrobactrum sp. 19YEA23]